MSIESKSYSLTQKVIARVTLAILAISSVPVRSFAADSSIRVLASADAAQEDTRSYSPQNRVERAVFSASETARREVMKMLRLTLETLDVEKIQIFAADSALLVGYASHRIREDVSEPLAAGSTRWSAGIFGFSDELAKTIEDNFGKVLATYAATNYAVNVATRSKLYKEGTDAFGKTITASGKDFTKTGAAARAAGRLAAWTLTPIQNAAMAAEVGIYGPLATSLNAGEKLTTRAIPMLQPNSVRDLLVAVQGRIRGYQQSSKATFDTAMHYTTHYREYAAAATEALGDRAKALSLQTSAQLRQHLMAVEVKAIQASFGKFLTERGALALARTSAGVSVAGISVYGAKKLSASVHGAAEKVRNLGPEEAYRIVEGDSLISAYIEDLVDELSETLGIDADTGARIKESVSKALAGEMLAKGSDVTKYDISLPKILEEIVGKSKADILKAMLELMGMSETEIGKLEDRAAQAEQMLSQSSFMVSLGALLEDALSDPKSNLSEAQKAELRKAIEESKKAAQQILALLKASKS